MTDTNGRGSTWRVKIGLAISLIGSAIIVSFVVADIRERKHRAACANVMKQIGLAMTWHTLYDPYERFPPLSARPGLLAVSQDATQKLHQAMEAKKNPSDLNFDHKHWDKIAWSAQTVWDNIFSDKDYFYLGYAVADDNEIEIFAKAYRESAAAGVALDYDIEDPAAAKPFDRKLLYRLREGIERAFVTRFGYGPGNPAQSYGSQARLPILFERIGKHNPAGGQVLYMDGHVEFIEYPGKWPMTENTVRILNELDALGAATLAK